MRTPARRVTLAWLLLVLLTLLSMTTGHVGSISLIGNGIVLAATVFKGRWMLMDFMKFRTVPSGWRVLFLSWLLLVAGAAWVSAALPMLLG